MLISGIRATFNNILLINFALLKYLRFYDLLLLRGNMRLPLLREVEDVELHGLELLEMVIHSHVLAQFTFAFDSPNGLDEGQPEVIAVAKVPLLRLGYDRLVQVADNVFEILHAKRQLVVHSNVRVFVEEADREDRVNED